jgi:Na+/H+-dicarboxylate symporter
MDKPEKFLLTINLLRHLSGFYSILVTVVTSGMRTVDDPKVTTTDGMNILGLVVFSIFFGCTLSRMGPSGKPLADFFECMHIATMKIVTLIIWYSKSKMNCYDIHYMNALLSFQLKQMELFRWCGIFSSSFYYLYVLILFQMRCDVI